MTSLKPSLASPHMHAIKITTLQNLGVGTAGSARGAFEPPIIYEIRAVHINFVKFIASKHSAVILTGPCLIWLL